MVYTLYLTVYYLITIGLIYYYSVFLYKYTTIGVSKVFDEKIIWDKYVEKPRLLIYVISAFYTWIAFNSNTHTKIEAFIKILLYSSAFLLIWLSHTKPFIKVLSNKENNSQSKTILLNNNLNTQTITDFIIKKKWFRGINIDTNISKLINYQLQSIDEKSIICSFDKQIQIGKILFQLKDIGWFNETQLRDIYHSNLIITSKGDSIKNAYSFHKNKLNKSLYNDDEINLKKYF